MREVFPELTALLLAQKPLPSQDILRRYKTTGAIETRQSYQRNTRSNAVHKEPPGRTVPHIIAYATIAPHEKGPPPSKRALRTDLIYELNPTQFYLPSGTMPTKLTVTSKVGAVVFLLCSDQFWQSESVPSIQMTIFMFVPL